MEKCLWDRYFDNEIQHVHISDNPLRNIFEDALCIQGNRIYDNLKKYFPKKTHDEIMAMMFGRSDEGI